MPRLYWGHAPFTTSTSLGGPKLGFFYPNPDPTRHMVTPGISTQPGGQRVSGGWVGATERRPKTWHAESRQPTASSCGTRDAKCTYLGNHPRAAKLQSDYSLGGPAPRLGPTSQRPPLPLSQLTWFNYIKPHLTGSIGNQPLVLVWRSCRVLLVWAWPNRP